MIYFFYGTDSTSAQKKAKATFDALQKKKPDASFVSFDSASLSESALQEITSSQGLFERKIVARLSDVLESKDISEFLIPHIEALQKTENIIVWSEAGVAKEALAKIAKNSEKIEEFSKREVAKRGSDNFVLADAAAKRDRKHSWALYRRLIEQGSSPEEIHGTIVWQFKNIALAMHAKSASETGQSPFVFSKAKTAGKLWKKEELHYTIFSLVSMYHESHRGKMDFETSLEKFFLGV